MAATPDLVLRDVHAAPATSWWPLAPGWWLVLALVVAALAIASAMAWRKRARRRAFARVFDTTLASAPTPVARVAAISELLRRAARVRDPDADRYEGERWRAHLDAGAKRRLFEGESGALLLEGPFRRDVDPTAVEALQRRARQRYLEWMR